MVSAPSKHQRSVRAAAKAAPLQRARSARETINARGASAAHPGMASLVNAAWDHPAVSKIVSAAILGAAQGTSIDPDLLTTLAWRESRFDPTVGNSRSSARGLLQFTSETWLQDLREFRVRHGNASYAVTMHRGPLGGCTVEGHATREATLRLRDDPGLSARMTV